MLAKVDATGSLTWTRNIFGLQNWEGKEIQELATGGFVMAAHTDAIGAGGIDFYLLFTDSDGYWISGPSIGGDQDDVCWGMDQTYDGGYVMVGTTRSYGPGISSVFVVKTDGNIVNTAVVQEVDPLPVIEQQQLSDPLLIYPNPVINGNDIVISIGDDLSSRSVRIFDQSGRIALDRTLPPTRTALSLTGIVAGAYIVEVRSDHGTAIGSRLLLVSSE